MSESSRDYLLPAVSAVIVALLAGGGFLAYAGWKHLRENESHPRYVTLPSPPPPPIATTTPTTPTTPTFVSPTDTSVVTPPTTTTSTEIPNAERTIAGMRPGFRRCYNKGLAEDPSMKGSIVISIRVDPDGSVVSATKVVNTGLSPAVEACILARANTATFAASTSGGTVRVPLTFVSAP